MLRGNILILRNLPEMLGLTTQRFCRKYGILKRTWERWMNQYGDDFNPQVTEFVHICNKLRLAPHKLIESDLTPLHISHIEDIFPPGGDWQEVRFDHATFASYFGLRGPIGLTIEDMMGRMNKTYQTFKYGWSVPEKCTLRLNDLFLFCHLFNIDVNNIIIDPNGRIGDELIHSDAGETELAQRLRLRERRIQELNDEVKRLKDLLNKERSARLIAEEKVAVLREELMSDGWNRMIAADGGNLPDDMA